MQLFKQGMRKESFLSVKDTKGVPFLPEVVYRCSSFDALANFIF